MIFFLLQFIVIDIICITNTIKTLYTTYIRPHLDFAVSVWSPYLEKDIKVIESVQHRVTKAIKGCNSLEYLERLDKLGLTTNLDVSETKRRFDSNFFPDFEGIK